MWLRMSLAVVALSVPTMLTEDSCGGGGTDPTPTPDPGTLTDYQKFEALLEDLAGGASQSEKQQMVDDFFYDVAYSGGFPIVEGQQVTFVMQPPADLSAPWRVAGDFNAWNPNANAMAKADGFTLYYTTVQLSDPEARSLYKFVGEAGTTDTYIPDAHSRRFQWDTYGEYSLISGGASASHLEWYPAFYSDDLGNTRDMFIYLPAGYDDVTTRMATLYMHDGQNLFDPAAFYGGWQADDVADTLIKTGQIDPVIMVGLANTPGRMEEYTHTEDFLPAYGGYIGGDGPLYASFIVDQVKPFIDARYRTLPQQENTGVLGSSLGGLISYYIGWAYPDTFRFVGGMSSTFGWGKINLDNDTVIDLMSQAPKRDQIFYIDSGGGAVGPCDVDTDGDGCWDDNSSASDNYCETLQMKSVLESRGYVEGVDLTYVWAPGAEHNEASWHDRMDEALKAFAGR